MTRRHSLVAAALTALTLLALNPVAEAAKGETKYSPKPSSYEKLPAAKKGGTLFLGLSNNPKVMNPVLSGDANSSTFDGLIFAPLFTEDSDTLQPLPYVAESYTVSADRKAYTFVINKEAKWQDGTAITTDDVKFTFDTMMNPKTDAAPLRAYWEGVTLEVKDPQTFVFKVQQPKFDTLRSLYLFYTIQKKQFANEGDFNKAKGILNPIGSGPYMLKSFSRDQKVELARNPNWWGNKLKHMQNRFNFDTITFKIVTDPSLEYERFVKGDLDLMNFAGPGNETYVKKVRGTDKDKFGEKAGDGKPLWANEFKNKAPRGFSYVGWNLRKPVFQSVKTRKALAMLADYKTISEKVFYGFQYQSTSPFGSLSMNADPELRKPGKMIEFDRKKALALLKEDGWADTDKDNVLDKTVNGQKVPFKFTIKYNSNNPARGKVAQILKENFKAAGIDMDIRSMEWNAFLTDVDNRDFDAVILAWTATPYPNPKQTWHTDAEKNKGSNYVGYSNKKVDELIEKANTEFDLNKRAKILHEINRLIYEDQPYMFLLEPRSLLAGFNKKLKAPVWAMTYDVDVPFDIYTAE